MGPREFWKNYYDKIITVFVSTVIALTVGYFSGVIAINSDLARIRERLSTVENTINIELHPKALTTAEHEIKFVELDMKFEKIKDLNDLAAQTNKLLELTLQQERRNTVSDLKILLEKRSK